MDIFRYRCYLAAVKDSPVPNPQTLLSCVSRNVKHTLSKLGLFSVASFHAFVSVRESLAEPPVKAEKSRRKLRGATGLKSKLLQSLKIVDDKLVEGIRHKHSPRIKRRYVFKYSVSFLSVLLALVILQKQRAGGSCFPLIMVHSQRN